VRNHRLRYAFPLDTSDKFGKTPALLCSRGHLASTASAVNIRGVGQPGDIFVLATDAISQWCLAEHEARRAPWEKIGELLLSGAEEREFEAWVTGLRASNQIENDDVAVIAIAL